MARLITCGWESGDPNEFGVYTGSSIQAAVTSNPLPRTPGQYCWKVGGSNGYGFRTVTLRTIKTDLWLRFAFWQQLGNTEYPLCEFRDTQGQVQGILSWSFSDSYLRVYRGEFYQIIGSSAPLQVQQQQWHTVDIHWQILSVDLGNVEVWVDDQQWMVFTNVDNTYATGSGGGLPNIQQIVIGNPYTSSFTSTIFTAFDDVALNDTTGTVNNGRVGDGRIVALRPNGAGSNSAQSRGGTDTGANWSQVNEIPPSMSQYVQSAVPGTRDTYALGNTPAGIWTVSAVEVAAFTQSSEAGPSMLGMTVVSGGTTSEGAPQIVTTGQSYVRSTWDVDPNTGTGWTVAALDALEAGTTVR